MNGHLRGSWTDSIDITWKLVRTKVLGSHTTVAESEDLELQPATCLLTSLPGDLDASHGMQNTQNLIGKMRKVAKDYLFCFSSLLVNCSWVLL